MTTIKAYGGTNKEFWQMLDLIPKGGYVRVVGDEDAPTLIEVYDKKYGVDRVLTDMLNDALRHCSGSYAPQDGFPSKTGSMDAIHRTLKFMFSRVEVEGEIKSQQIIPDDYSPSNVY